MRHEARQGTSETSSKTGDKIGSETGSETGGKTGFCTMDLCSFADFVEFLVAC